MIGDVREIKKTKDEKQNRYIRIMRDDIMKKDQRKERTQLGKSSDKEMKFKVIERRQLIHEITE